MVWEDAMASISAQQLLLVAARNGDKADTLRLLMEDGVLIDCKDTMGFTPLMWAVYFNHTSVAELLLSYVANYETKNSGGHTPLHIAVSKGSLGCVTALCKAGANLAARAKNGYTPLHEACYYGKMRCILALLDSKAPVDMRCNEGCTPLHIAASKGNAAACEALINFEANIDATDALGRTPLHLAASIPNGKLALELLIEKGANFTKKCSNDRTPLQYALDNNCAQCASILRLAETRPSYGDPAHDNSVIEIKGEGDTPSLTIANDPNYDRPTNGSQNPVKYPPSTPAIQPTPTSPRPASTPHNSVNYPQPVHYPPPPSVSVNYKSDENSGAIFGSPGANNSFVNIPDDAEAFVHARMDDFRKEMEKKLELQNKLIQQLQLEKEKAEHRRKQQHHQFSQEISTLHDQLRIAQKQLEIGRTEKASTQLDLEISQKKLSLISTELQQQLGKQKSLHEQVLQLEESRVCKICFENPVDTVLFPCSHFCLCHSCVVAVVKKNRKCPICRAHIERSALCYFT